MDIKEILSKEAKEAVNELKKGRKTDLPDVDKYAKQLDPKQHKVFDLTFRPDKLVKDDDGNTRTEKVARIGLALQKLIVKRSVSFLFGNPVSITSETDDEQGKNVLNAVKEILKKAKTNTINKKAARILFSCTEVAELWYPVEVKPNESEQYGIGSKHKLKVKILNPLKGDILYPYFDEYDDLIAFSREYKLGKKRYFETYTDEQIIRYDITEGAKIVDGFPKKNEMNKIPIVYAKSEESDFEDVQDLIERLEVLLSNFSDTNDYHSSPTIFVKGGIKGFSKKGESGKVLEGEEQSDVKYISWQHAPESVKLEISTLINFIYTLTQTSDISFENIKGLGNGASGKALRMLFLDAHLKVQDNMEIFDSYLERRINILKAFIGTANTSLKSATNEVEISSEVTPYMVDDLEEELEFVMTASGNKPVLSQETAIKKAGLVKDSKEEYEKIQREQSIGVFEPTE